VRLVVLAFRTITSAERFSDSTGGLQQLLIQLVKQLTMQVATEVTAYSHIACNIVLKRALALLLSLLLCIISVANTAALYYVTSLYIRPPVHWQHPV
jgi:hypothetical protein